MSSPTNHVPTHFWEQQSPINLEKKNSIHLKFPQKFLKFDYKDAPFAGEFRGEKGHGNFVLDKPHAGDHRPKLVMGDMTAELIKIHLHTPSEHDLQGADLDGEIHLIHRLASPVNGSELVVVGVFFNKARSEGNREDSADKLKFFSKWAEQVVPKLKGTTASKRVSIDPRRLVPKNPNKKPWYRYEGSLTSEPYSEIVSWLVLAEPVGIGSSDFKKLKNYAHQPERAVQPINRRFVLRNF
ncbi:carbonic anhydrase family protein [Aureliella helgolandensis]|uniref:carbonic anhydrase n=1 Tax=Aureliella helgolandensis TaxID=2527968 RepID=A0A518G9J2_9BACT|nr:carbonic anhydrase family protein [Aureliella helgolandensis]QDV25268.1 Carbonic anhydrase precursor [Aureliella helgolandensis]